MNPETEVECQRILKLLETLIRILGLSKREIERRIDLSPSYLSRLFGGYLELKLEHVLEIGRALGLKPREVFELAYPESFEPPSEAMEKIRGILNNLQPRRPAAEPSTRPAPGLSVQELERLVQEAIRQVFQELGRT